jgi:hypothetical protein
MNMTKVFLVAETGYNPRIGLGRFRRHIMSVNVEEYKMLDLENGGWCKAGFVSIDPADVTFILAATPLSPFELQSVGLLRDFGKFVCVPHPETNGTLVSQLEEAGGRFEIFPAFLNVPLKDWENPFFFRTYTYIAINPVNVVDLCVYPKVSKKDALVSSCGPQSFLPEIMITFSDGNRTAAKWPLSCVRKTLGKTNPNLFNCDL